MTKSLLSIMLFSRPLEREERSWELVRSVILDQQSRPLSMWHITTHLWHQYKHRSSYLSWVQTLWSVFSCFFVSTQTICRKSGMLEIRSVPWRVIIPDRVFLNHAVLSLLSDSSLGLPLACWTNDAHFHITHRGAFWPLTGRTEGIELNSPCKNICSILGVSKWSP